MQRSYRKVLKHFKSPIIIGLFFCSYASSNIQLIAEHASQITELSNNQQWHTLLGFHDKKLDYAEEEFYISPEKHFDPRAELIATLNAYISNSSQDSSDSIACRFPGRMIFLIEELTFLPAFNFLNCKDFSLWSENHSIESISLLFVSGYLQNPASFFGHTLLKFNSTTNTSNLLDRSLNYGAITNNDAALPYILRGLSGRYDARLTTEKFFRHSAIYSEFQMRDIWEYELNLNKFQINLILGHTFEILGKQAQYFFLNDNCAYRMNLILSLVMPQMPIPEYLPWKSPIDLLMGLNSQEGLIAKIKYHPSLEIDLRESIQALSPKEKSIFTTLATKNLSSKQIDHASNDLKLAILNFNNYKKIQAYQAQDDLAAQAADRNRSVILLNIAQSSSFKKASYPLKVNGPEQGTLPTTMMLKFKNFSQNNGNLRGIQSLRLRGANFDFLDRQGSKSGNSEFTFLSPQISFKKSHVFLDDFILFKVNTLNDLSIKIPGSSSFAWGLEVGRMNLADSCYPCNVAKFSAQIGKSYRINDLSSAYSFIGAAAHESFKGSGNLSLYSKAGLLTRPKAHISILLEYETKQFDASKSFDEHIISIMGRYHLSNRMSIGAGYKKRDNTHFTEININKSF